MSRDFLAEIQKMSFEEALEELEEIVRALEAGRVPLDDAINSYERGSAIKKYCELKLKDAETRIEKITVSHDKSLKAEHIDLD